MGNKMLFTVNIPIPNTTIVAVPILIKLITAEACDLSSALLMASDDALARIKHNPK